MEENYKILLVDDEEEVRTSIIRKIDWEKTGFTVIGDAENGRDALEKIELLEPDVVLTDIRMPYMDGLELAAELHRSRPSIRLVIFSGYDDFEYAKQAIRLDITEYILKPVNARELTEILEKLRASLDEEIERLRGETALRESFAKNLDVLRENFLGNLVKGKAESAQIARSMEEYGLGLMRGNCWTALKINIGGGGSIFSMTKEQSMAAVPVRRLLDSRLSEWGEFTRFHRPSGLSVIAALEDEAALAGLMTLLDDVCRESRKILRQPLTVGIGRIVSRIEEIEQSYSSAREAVSYGGIAGDVIYINDVEPQQRAMLWLDDKAGAELNHALCFGDEESILSCVENIVRPMKGGAMANGVQAYLIGILNVILRVVQKYGLDEQLIFIIDHIIDTLVHNIPLMNFISKNLVMGALRSVLLTGERSDSDFYEIFLDMVRQDSYEYQDIDVMLFTIVELAGSAGYNSILYKEPLPIEQYKPFLYRSVRLIIDSHRTKQ